MSNVLTDFGAGMTAFAAPVDARIAFIRRTYAHVAGAVALFVAASWAFYTSGIGEKIAMWAFGSGGAWRWLLIIGGFAALGWLGQSMARADRARSMQYGGLVLYAGIEALVFSPMIWYANEVARGVLGPAAVITLLVFAGLTGIVLTTKKDFAFLGMFLKVGMLVALGLIVCGAIFGFNLGLWFSGAMILMASGAILYSTSRVLHQYRTDQHVSAAIELFAAVALLFWYVLRLLMELNGRNR